MAVQSGASSTRTHTLKLHHTDITKAWAVQYIRVANSDSAQQGYGNCCVASTCTLHHTDITDVRAVRYMELQTLTKLSRDIKIVAFLVLVPYVPAISPMYVLFDIRSCKH